MTSQVNSYPDLEVKYCPTLLEPDTMAEILTVTLTPRDLSCIDTVSLCINFPLQVQSYFTAMNEYFSRPNPQKKHLHPSLNNHG